METSFFKTNIWTSIRVYDTDLYPEYKTNATLRGTPTASYTVPINLGGREADLKWNSDSTVLQMRHDGIPGSPGGDYNLDLTTFSFSEAKTN